MAAGGHFYVIAGRDSGNFTAVERYDPRRRAWEDVPDMRTPRGGIASARLGDGRIVVFGGENLEPGGTTIAAVELFDPRTGRWSDLPSMRTPRHGLGGVALGRRVYAIQGGVEPGFSFSNAIEFLDVRQALRRGLPRRLRGWSPPAGLGLGKGVWDSGRCDYLGKQCSADPVRCRIYIGPGAPPYLEPTPPC